MKDVTLKNFCCPNEKCPRYGVLGKNNIYVRAVSGQNGTRRLCCRVCNHTFSEYSGTILDNSRLAPQKIIDILKHLAEGKSQREIGRLLSVDRGAVSRYAKLAGEYPKKLHDELVATLSASRKGTVQRKMGLDPKKKRYRNVSAVMQLLTERCGQDAYGHKCFEFDIMELESRLPYLRNKRSRTNRRTLDRTLQAVPGIRYGYCWGGKRYTFAELSALGLRQWRHKRVKVVIEYDNPTDTNAVPVLQNTKETAETAAP
jgi:transposase-like protein